MDKIIFIKQLVVEVFEHGNLKLVDTAFSPQYLAHAGEKTYSGHKFIRQFNKQIRSAIPDLKILKIEILAQADPYLTWQRTFSGTHKKSLKGIPASNRKVKWYEIVVTRFENDQIAEEWLASDLAFQLMLKNK